MTKNNKYTIRQRNTGLSLVEVMLFMTIGVMLLTAVAVAFRSSFNSYRESQERGQLLNDGRSFMSRIVRDIRAADGAAPYDLSPTTTTIIQGQYQSQLVPGSPTSGLTGSGVTGITILKTHPDTIDPNASVATPVIVTYWYDSASQQVMMTRQSSSATVTPVVICRYVQSLQIFMQPLYLPPNPALGQSASIILQRAVITLTQANRRPNGSEILSGTGQSLTLVLTDSAVPRRNYSGV